MGLGLMYRDGIQGHVAYVVILMGCVFICMAMAFGNSLEIMCDV